MARVESKTFRVSRAAGAVAALGLLALTGCQEDGYLPKNSRHWVALSPEIQSLMAEKGLNARSPILIRAYKKESELEIWKANAAGEYQLLKTYPMCRWSGQLGPKKTEGDRQVPEGFYAITQNQLNPNSSFYLSFNVGYPNSYDRAYGRSGSHIMVHGACSSRGCFSMTDHQIAEIYALTREAFGGGQKAVQMHSLPFRMTPQNFAKFRADENLPFWKNLKEGSDHFEISKREPQVAVCGRKYVFNATPKDGGRFDASSSCPPVERDAALVAAVEQKNRADEQQVAALASGTKAVKRIYHDGDQHHSFKQTVYASVGSDQVSRASATNAGVSRVAEVSQPDALAGGPVEVPAEQARGLNRQQLIAKAQSAKQQEMAAIANPVPAPVAAPAAPATATPAPAKAVANAPKANAAPPATKATALVASDAAQKDQPAFYQRWMGSLGGLSASATGAEEIAPQAVQAPTPPKAPKR